MRYVEENKVRQSAADRSSTVVHGGDLVGMIKSVSEEFLGIKKENLPAGLHKLLQNMGTCLGFDRAYIVFLPGMGGGVNPRHYWFAEGVTLSPSHVCDILEREDSLAAKHLAEGKILYMSSIGDGPDSAFFQNRVLQEEGMRSIVVFPMTSGGIITGYMGFDSLHAQKELSDPVQAIVQLIANVISLSIEHIKAEDALKESEKGLLEMIDHATDGMMIEDFDGNIMVVNKQQALRTGYSKEEILSMNIDDLFPSSSNYKDTEESREKLAAGEPVVFEYVVTRRNGSKLDVEVKLVKIVFNGKPALFSVSHDITERKKTEQALRESEVRFHILNEQSRDGIVILDQKGNVYQSNKQFAAMIGYSPEEMSQLHVTDWEYLYPRDRLMEMIRTVDENGDHFETVHRRRDGSTYFVEISTNAAVIGGQKLIFCICRDISKRKKDEEALRESEARFRELIDQAADAILVHDHEGNVLMANAQAVVISGCGQEELLSMNMADIFQDVAVSDHRKKYWRHVEKGDSLIFETTIGYKDGSTAIIEVKLAGITFAGRDAILAFSRDITERKKAEQALRESEQKFRELVEKAVEGIIVNDLEGNILMVNDKKCQLMGYSREEFLAHNMTYFFPEISEDDHIEKYWKKLEPGSMISFAREEKKKDGTIFPAEIQITKIMYDGQPAILAFTRDISERKKAEAAIKEERDKAQKYLDVAGVLIMALDADGTVEMMNKKGCEVLGYEEKEIIGKNWVETFMPECERPVLREKFKDIVSGTVPFPERLENTVVTASGAERIISWTIVAIRDEKGAITGMLRSGEDITERRKAEREKKEMESKARLTSHLASIGEMASGVAHEINNPLTGVIGYSQLLMNENLPENIREDIRVIHDGAQRVSEIVRKLLSFARQNKAERTLVNINEMLENTLSLMAYELRTNNIQVTTRLAPALPLTMADGGQIQQVFINIARNALLEMKRSRGEGKLVIETAQRQKNIVISFQDNGPGIEEANLNKIFDPFFTTREIGEGTGLGLSVCHGIISEHGGSIGVKSTHGEGAKFTVYLPIIKESAKAPKNKLAGNLHKSVRHASILVVDDEPKVHEFVDKVLSEEGHRVEVVDNAMDALALVRNNNYDLILLDIVMPGMSGLELYKHLATMNPSLTGRILIITGDVMNSETESSLRELKTRYITKPFDVTYFKQVIAEMLNGKG